MSLEEEIAIIQFAQAIHSDERLLTRFSQLDDEKQRTQFMALSFLVWQVGAIESDAVQALSDSSLGIAYIPGTNVTRHSVWTSSLDLSRKDPMKEYTFLLYLYKAAYQRQFISERSNPANWLYQDLSKPETVQAILDTHQALVDRLYTITSFRSEFAALAKHWKSPTVLEQTNVPDPAPVQQEKLTFMNYRAILDHPLDEFIGGRPQGIGLLCNALANALVIQFGVTDKQARRLIQDVVAKHWQESKSPEIS